MESVLTRYSASISELKRNPTALLREAEGETIAILNHNIPTAYLVPADIYAEMMDIIEDFELSKLVRERLAEVEQEGSIRVNIDDL